MYMESKEQHACLAKETAMRIIVTGGAIIQDAEGRILLQRR
ncbi:hypothetical protein [Paenibacillus dendrobii]|nr:hypothetical protein [Paenibacillus dendrobii]